MSILQITAAAVCVSVLALLVKNINSSMGKIVSVAAIVVIISAIIPYAIKIIDSLREFSTYSRLGSKYIKPILKITGTAYVAQIGSQLCEDNGEKTLAARVETAGKLAITVISLPIAKEAFVTIMNILS